MKRCTVCKKRFWNTGGFLSERWCDVCNIAVAHVTVKFNTTQKEARRLVIGFMKRRGLRIA